MPTFQNSRVPFVAVLPLTAVWVIVPGLSPFWVMVAIALSLFGLIKLHTLLRFTTLHPTPSVGEIVLWFFAWPGLDGPAFFHRKERSELPAPAPAPALQAWGLASAKMLFGGVLFVLVAPVALPQSELLAGWIGLVGVVFMLHFGLFHLLALLGQRQGREVRPIMNAPILATSVSDFWSQRWNLAFRDYANPVIFKPLARRFSPVTAVIAGYLFSGIIHELVISVPAGAGYGLPTLYFLLQGVGILVERWAGKRGMRLKGGWRGWGWTLLVVLPAAGLLFHPPFIRSVVVPLVEVIANHGWTFASF